MTKTLRDKLIRCGWVTNFNADTLVKLIERHYAARAAQWGADQELEACCEWMADETPTNYINALHAARRPKLPSLKELALESVKRFEKSGEFFSDQMSELEFIRKALEQLDD
jgi:hypothetical protein